MYIFSCFPPFQYPLVAVACERLPYDVLLCRIGIYRSVEHLHPVLVCAILDASAIDGLHYVFLRISTSVNYFPITIITATKKRFIEILFVAYSKSL